MYKYALKKEQVELPKNNINIYSFQVLNFSPPFCTFFIECSKGTYVRSVANEIGLKLDCYAHCTELQRLSIGDYHVDDAFEIEDVKKMGEIFINETKNTIFGD